MNSDNLIGNILSGRYDIIEKIGTGGMASVYKAKDTLLNRYVAIKVLRDALEGEKNIVANFIKEAQSSASLVHNNIVSVFDVGEDDGVNYMVMELVDGRTLKEYIKEKGSLPWQEACDYCIQIGQGLMEAHAKHIIHRDIKPQNIIMTKGKTLKVTDFGIARALTSDTTTVGGTALGSVHYISPEQARGGFTDVRSDIYSLGIVLYEMLTGKVPFDGENAVSVALMHLEKDPVNVKCVNMDIPQDLAYVTMKAIAKEQANRYQSVSEMLEDLHAVLAGEPLASKESGVTEDTDNIVYDEDDYCDDDDYDDYEDDFIDEDEIELKPRKKAKKNKKKNKKQESYDDDEGDIEPKKKKKQKSPEQKKADRLATLLAILTVVVLVLGVAGAYFFMNTAMDIKVPSVENMKLADARKAIEDVGLSVSDEIEYSLSNDIDEGNVIAQTPDSGKKIAKGSDVSLVVSIGSSEGTIKLPSLEKLAFEDAVTKLAELKLKYAVVEDYSDDVKAGTVIRHTPLKGTMLSEEDIVTLHVSRGKMEVKPTKAPEAAKVTVPSLNGDTKETAEAKLQKLGLTVGSITSRNSETIKDFIISQSPEAGKLVEPGSVVNIIISKGFEGSDQNKKPTETTDPDKSETSDEDENSNDEDNEEEDNTEEDNTEEKNPSVNGTKKTSFTVKIPDAAGDKVNVEIVADGRTVHNALHNKNEGTVTVELEGKDSVRVQAYVDGFKVSDKVVEFN